MEGRCDPKFQRVADVFEENFMRHREVGAAVSIIVEGETVVDLWGGHSDLGKTKRWRKDTLSPVFSITKMAATLCANILIDRGLVRADDRISTYWPEFGQNGKSDITIAMVLNHSAGVPVITRSLPEGSYGNWETIISLIEEQHPTAPPAQQVCYHLATFGWILGELVQRVTGQKFTEFFQQEVSRLLDVEFYIGLPETEWSRLCEIKFFNPKMVHEQTNLIENLLGGPDKPISIALLNNGNWHPTDPASLRAPQPSGGGVTTARSLAKLLAPFAQDGHDNPILSRSRLDEIEHVSTRSETDDIFRVPVHYSQGFMRSMDNRLTHPGDGHSLCIGPRALGHCGWGGSICFADPERNISFGYVMNRIGKGGLLNRRGQSLIDAGYACT